MVERMSVAPNRILGLSGGALTGGKPADLTIVDPSAVWAVDPATFYSKSRNTAFEGVSLTGHAVKTILAGRIVFDREAS